MGVTIEWLTATTTSIDVLSATDEAADGQRTIDDGGTPQTIAVELGNGGGGAAITGTPEELLALFARATAEVTEHHDAHSEGDTTGERGEVWSNDPESLECVCGNHANFDGLVSATGEGIALELYPHDLPKPEGLAAWPEDADEVHRLCPACGRLYLDKTIRDTNTAPVVQLVDLTDGTPARNALVALDAELGHPSTELQQSP